MIGETVTFQAGETTDEQVSCRHCGADCGAEPVVWEQDAFCCAGCRTVYELLRDAGLGDYYTLTDRPGIRPEASRESGRFAFLDDERVVARLLQFAAPERARITFRVPAIHCVSCVWLLENLHRLTAGVFRVEVDMARGLVTALFNPTVITVRGLVETMAAIGYEPDLRLRDLAEPPTGRADRGLVRRVALAGFCFGNVMLLSFPVYFGLEAGSLFAHFFGWAGALLAFPALIYSASGYWRAAWIAVRRRAVTLDVPIAIGMATLAIDSAWQVVTGQGPGYFDSLTGLIFFLLLGRLVQARSYDRLRFDHDYASFFPLAARRLDADGSPKHVPVDSLQPGDQLLLRHGELMPADGILCAGDALLDYSFVTGETDPVPAPAGARIYAGARQTAGEIRVILEKSADASYLTSLWSHLPNAGNRNENAGIWRVTGGWFTGLILAIAGSAAAWWLPIDHGLAVRAFASVLIVACPCALALAAPLGFGFAARHLARCGLFLRDGSCVEQLARIRMIVFDKTGTLTQPGGIRLTGPLPTPDHARKLAIAAAQSAHPISRMIAASLGGSSTATTTTTDFHEAQGLGITATVDGSAVKIGRPEWCGLPPGPGTWATVGDQTYGPWLADNAPADGIPDLLSRLARRWRLALLTGDHEAGTVDIRALFPQANGAAPDIRCRQQPHDKLTAVNDWESQGFPVLMVGDGLNDAGALRAGTAGIAVGHDAGGFFPACDGLIQAQNLPRLDHVLTYAKYVRTLVYGNMALSLLYNGVGLYFAVSGQLSPLVAAVLMPASSLSVLALTAGGTAVLAKFFVHPTTGEFT